MVRPDGGRYREQRRRLRRLRRRCSSGYFGTAGAIAACWFAVGTAVNLAVGRLPFALGLAFGLVALLAYERRWIVLALLAAPLTSLASPVAGVFLAIGLGGIVIDQWLRRRNGRADAPFEAPIAMTVS